MTITRGVLHTQNETLHLTKQPVATDIGRKSCPAYLNQLVQTLPVLHFILTVHLTSVVPRREKTACQALPRQTGCSEKASLIISPLYNSYTRTEEIHPQAV